MAETKVRKRERSGRTREDGNLSEVVEVPLRAQRMGVALRWLVGARGMLESSEELGEVRDIGVLKDKLGHVIHLLEQDYARACNASNTAP